MWDGPSGLYSENVLLCTLPIPIQNGQQPLVIRDLGPNYIFKLVIFLAWTSPSFESEHVFGVSL